MRKLWALLLLPLLANVAPPSAVRLPADVAASQDSKLSPEQEKFKALLDQYTAPNTMAFRRASIMKQINESVFPQKLTLDQYHPQDLEQYENLMEVAKQHPNIKSDLGTQMTLLLQVVWEQRFGPFIRQNLRQPQWGREGLIGTGTFLGYVSSIVYSRGKISLLSRIVSALIPYIGLGSGYVASKSTYDAKKAHNIPASPFELLGYGNDRPEDHHWDSSTSLTWELLDIMGGITAYPFAQRFSNQVISRYLGKKTNCYQAAESIVTFYAHQQNSLRFLTEIKGAGMASLRALGKVVTFKENPAGTQGDLMEQWRSALSLSKADAVNVRDYATDYLKAWGPAGMVGGVAGLLALRFVGATVDSKVSTASLRSTIEESEKRIEDLKAHDQQSALLLEGYRFRGLVEYYKDVRMVEITKHTEEQLLDVISQANNPDRSAAELEQINQAIRRSYSKQEWKVFAARIEAFSSASKQYTDLQMPALYKEVLADGLPDDPGNALLWGAAVLHKNGLMDEFKRISETIEYVYSYYQTTRAASVGGAQ